MQNEDFATRMRERMQIKGFKQADLFRLAADRDAKLGKSQVSQYVSGKTLPRRDVLGVLAGILDVSPDWLLEGSPENTFAHPSDASGKRVMAQSPTTVQTHDASPTQPFDQTGTVTMREFKKSSKLDNVLYDVRGAVVDEAARVE